MSINGDASLNVVPIAHITHASGVTCSFCAVGSVNSDASTCGRCGGLIWVGMLHTCAPAGPQWYWNNPPAPQPMYVIQACPVCEGRGNMPAGFYGRMAVGTGTAPEGCQSCDGRGLLKVSTIFGTVEKVPPA